MSTQEIADSSYKLNKNDPILFNSYVGKEITVTTTDRNTHCGVVYTVDPVSESIVLLQSGKSTLYCLRIIFGHAIKNIDVTSKTKMIPELFLSSPIKISQATIAERKKTIMRLLLENRLLVREENNILRIEDTISIEPPYYPENYYLYEDYIRSIGDYSVYIMSAHTLKSLYFSRNQQTLGNRIMERDLEKDKADDHLSYCVTMFNSICDY